MPDLTLILPRVASLVRLLSSPVDGEALGAARALGRTLDGAGASFHDLAAHVERDPEPAVVYRDAFGRKAKPPRVTAPLYEELKRSERLDWLAIAVESDELSEWQRGFAGSLRSRVYSQPHSRLSPKQCASLNEILAFLWIKGERP